MAILSFELCLNAAPNVNPKYLANQPDRSHGQFYRRDERLLEDSRPWPQGLGVRLLTL